MDKDTWYAIGIWTFLGLAVIPTFFSPTFIAIKRRRKIGTVFFCNLVLGWTVLGWGLAMAIAVDEQ